MVAFISGLEEKHIKILLRVGRYAAEEGTREGRMWAHSFITKKVGKKILGYEIKAGCDCRK